MNATPEVKKSVRDEFADKFIAILESDKPLSWVQGWASTGMGRPYNGSSNRPYNGINRFILGLTALENGWDDPRFFTFKGVSDMEGCHVRKGEHATRTEYFAVWDSQDRKTLSISEYQRLPSAERADERYRFFSKTAYVFNAAQIEGLEPLSKGKPQQFEDNRLAEAVLDTLSTNMDIRIQFGGDRAYYSPTNDYIQMPPKERFYTSEDYYCTLSHELSHSTGAESRLARPLDSLYANSESYAMEELRAEIASTYFCAELGIEISEQAMVNHQAYVASWLAAIRQDRNALFAALKDADKICDYMMEHGRVDLMKEEIAREALMPGVLEPGTTYEIWQLKDKPENRSISFLPYDYASQFRLTESRYDKLYESPVTIQDNSLDKIFCKFNIDRPADFKGHSLSMSDVIVTAKDGKKQAYYVDQHGFQPVQGFFQRRAEQRGKGR